MDLGLDISLKTRIKAINIFNDIYDILYKIDDVYRASKYLDAVNKIKRKDENKLSPNFILKLKEIESTGKLKSHDKLLEIKNLLRVPGFGKSTLRKMYNSTMAVDKYLKDKDLTKMQRIGLKYYKNILRKLNRKVVEFVSDRIKRLLRIRNLYSKFVVTGSYRRDMDTMEDVDILIVPKRNVDTKDISNKICKHLNYKSIKYADTYACGEKKFSFLIQVNKNAIDKMMNNRKKIRSGRYPGFVIYPNDEKKIDKQKKKYYYIQIDIRYVNNKEYPFALLYFTGSRTFNIMIRRKAIKMGLKLNEYRLAYKDGDEIDLKSEKEILEYLNMDEKYYNPRNRKKY